MTNENTLEWVAIKQEASVCIDGYWTTWPPEFIKDKPELRRQFSRLIFKVDGRIRKRARMQLMGFFPNHAGKVKRLRVLAWFHDLMPVSRTTDLLPVS